jgi:predicted nucleotidyltransferase component of viral defense system
VARDRECDDPVRAGDGMSTVEGPRRRWGSAYQLADLLERSEGGRSFAVRDFALLALAAHLSARFPSQLVFKGGFVLRHVLQLLRFSEDVDATRHNPARHKLDTEEVAQAIRDASVGDIIRFSPQEPATDTARSLDFDDVRVSGSLISDDRVEVEISYREEVVDPPVRALIGEPFYEPFEILAMAVPEMAAEKMRTLAQRVRVTDLADLAEMLVRPEVRDDDVARLAHQKFAFVAEGVANRADRVYNHLREMGADYDDAVPRLFPGARSYGEAMAIVWPRIKPLFP